MIKILRFYKETSGEWYADIPEWIEAGGEKEALQMVMGADNLLDIMAEGEPEVRVQFSRKEFHGSHVMSLLMHGYTGYPDAGGAVYRLHQYNGIEYDLDVWLCDVTKFVLGDMPYLIFFSKTI